MQFALALVNTITISKPFDTHENVRLVGLEKLALGPIRPGRADRTRFSTPYSLSLSLVVYVPLRIVVGLFNYIDITDVYS